MEEIICAREGCNEPLPETRTFNQKFHNAECCRIETNRRIMEKYYINRDRKAGKVRYCNKCTVTRLSRYNESQICSSCQLAAKAAADAEVVEMLSKVNWV